MFEKLKSGFKGLVNKVTTTELKAENLSPILSDFKMSLAENDVAFPVADKICDELEKRLAGVQVKRLEDRKKIVEDNLRQVLLDVMLTNKRIDLLNNGRRETQKKRTFRLNVCGHKRHWKNHNHRQGCPISAGQKLLVVLAAADTYRAARLSSWRSMVNVWVCV